MSDSDVPTLTVPQYCLLRSLKLRGIEASLVEIFLNRCGADRADWDHLTGSGYVVAGKRKEKGRFVLSEQGKRVYNRRPRNVWF